MKDKWKDVSSIELDLSPVFHYEIKIYDKKKQLLDKAIIKPPDLEKAMFVMSELNKELEKSK